MQAVLVNSKPYLVDASEVIDSLIDDGDIVEVIPLLDEHDSLPLLSWCDMTEQVIIYK